MNKLVNLDNHDIAIIGMAGRFPGAEDIGAYWRNLLGGQETIVTFTDAELRASGVDEALIADPNYIRRRGILGDAEYFDASFFDITPRDAEIMDPQHRHFLECSWLAFEDAGYIPSTYPGKVSVFGGTGTAWHLHQAGENPQVQKYASGASVVTNNDKDYVTTRVSYKLNLKGPSVDVQTACSTAMVAIVMGVNSLRNGESDMALAGGVSIDTPERRGYQYMQGGMESADGHCYAFDARANGTVFSRGVGVVLLKRLSDAINDGDHIYALIKGGAINNDGNTKAGFTAPGIDGQIDVAKEALRRANVNPATISFVEAHGTATALGDPIEFSSLSQTFQQFTAKNQFCRLGSVKTNIGHTDAASGVASLIKTALALKNRILPASLHYKTPNPNIDFANSPFFINTETQALEANGEPLRALVNSFGVGGTNACVIMEQAPEAPASSPSKGYMLFPCSAKTPTALEKMRENLRLYVAQNERINLADMAYTLQVGRQHMAHSSFIVASDREALLSKLAQPTVAPAASGKNHKSVVFMFPGQGNQYINMARDLYQDYAVFRQHLDTCCAQLDGLLGRDLRSVIFQEADSTDKHLINETQYTQPALFVVEYALAQLWMSWGIKPDVMIGHSVGEYVAACLSGVLSLEDALTAVAMRGKLVQQLPAGAMLAVLMDEDALRERLSESQLEIAAANYPGLCVIAGSLPEIEVFQNKLEDDGIFCKHLDTSHAFHSYMMEPMLEDFREVIAKIAFNPPQIPFVSTVTGDFITDSQAQSQDYWVNHVRQPVLFTHAFKTLIADGHRQFVFLEVGPGRSLESAAKQHINTAENPAIFASLPTAKDVALTGEQLLIGLGNLWCNGVAVDWSNYYVDQHRQRLPLPGYPFERKAFALPQAKGDALHGLDNRSVNARKKKQASIDNWFYMPAWRQTIPAKYMSGKAAAVAADCWVIFADKHGVANALRAQLSEDGFKVITVTQSATYQEHGTAFAIDPDNSTHYVSLLASLKKSGLTPTRILHLWSLAQADDDTQLLDNCGRFERDAFYSPMYLQQALIGENLLEGLRLLLVTNGIYSVTGEPIGAPHKALLTGPARVFYHEYHEVHCHLVDVDLTTPAADIAGLLIAESHINSDGNLVAYRGNQRWEEAYQQVPLPAEASHKPVAIRDDGVYLITGGLGGIGMLVAEQLAQSSNATLVLTYRSPLPARAEWQHWIQQHAIDDAISEKLACILRLEEQGNRVHLLNVDVCDYTGMKAGLAEFPRIDGVFHTAGVAGGGIIPLKNNTNCTDVLAPKVRGTLILDQLLADRSVDFFLMFSSITAIVGDPARIDYCAGNAFMDVFAHYRNQHRPGYSMSINWGQWADIGMAARWNKQQNEKIKNTLRGKITGDLLSQIDSKNDEEIFRVNLAVNRDWVIDEHRLLKTPTLVGTTILSLLNEYLAVFKSGDALEVKNLMLSTPVLYHHAWPREMNLIVSQQDKGYRFSLKSRGILDFNWQEHAFGQIGEAKSTAGKDMQPEAIRQRCSTVISDCAFSTNQDFLALSPRWQTITELRKNDSEWFIQLALAKAYSDDLRRYAFHPAMIDSVAIACLSNLTEDHYLPISYGHIGFHAPLGESCFVHAALTQPYQPGDNTLVMNIVFFSAQGKRLMTLDNYTLIKIADNNQVNAGRSNKTPEVKVNLQSKDIFYFEGQDAVKRILNHLTFPQLVVVTSDLEQFIFEAIPEKEPEDNVQIADSVVDSHGRPALSVDYVPPENDIEKEVAKVWQSILGISGIGALDNFTELGGNSLLAVQVVSIVAGIFEVDIRVDLFYQDQTIRGMANLLVSELIE